MAEEDAIDDAVHIFEHLLDSRGRFQRILKVNLVGVDPFVWIMWRHGALLEYLGWQGVVLLAEERQLDFTWKEVLNEHFN